MTVGGNAKATLIRNGLALTLAVALGVVAGYTAGHASRSNTHKHAATTAATIAGAAAPATGSSDAGSSDSASSSTTPIVARTSGSKWVLGYYAVYEQSMLPPDQVAWGDLTHIVVTRVVPMASGDLDTSFDYDATAGPQVAKTLAYDATAHGVVPILMVGGAGTHDDFVTAATDHESTLVDSLLAEMKQLGFAGLDLDLEPVNAPDEAPLLKLATDLRAKDPGIVLSVPVGWTSTTFPTVDPFYAQLANQVDREDVMTYSMADAWSTDWRAWFSSALHGAGPNWPTAVDVSVDSYLAAGVPASKLGVGIGFYGSCWTGGETSPRQSTNGAAVGPSDNVMTYPYIMKSYYSSSAYHYDATAEAPYLTFSSPHGAQQCTYISYEDPRSVAAKVSFAKSKGLGGVIVWTINQGHDSAAAPGSQDTLLTDVAKDVG